jgi:hypothetical protein
MDQDAAIPLDFLSEATVKWAVKTEIPTLLRLAMEKARLVQGATAGLSSVATANGHAWTIASAEVEAYCLHLKDHCLELNSGALLARKIGVNPSAWHLGWKVFKVICLTSGGQYTDTAAMEYNSYMHDIERGYTVNRLKHTSWARFVGLLTTAIKEVFPLIKAAALMAAKAATYNTGPGRSASSAPGVAHQRVAAPSALPGGDRKSRYSTPWADRATLPPAHGTPQRADWIYQSICRRNLTGTCPFPAASCHFAHECKAFKVSIEEAQAVFMARASLRK